MTDDRGSRLQAALHWTRVTTCDNIPPREGRAVSLAGREIAIFNLGPSTELGAGNRFLAVDNQCPHKAGPLADGIVTGMSVVCPLHTWKISLVDGRVERPSGSSDQVVTTYPTRVNDGIVVVGVPASTKPAGEDRPVVAEEADKTGLKLQDCQTEDRLLHERRVSPPCPHADGCVSSNMALAPRAPASRHPERA
jgi:nitrite reductase (NADH) small subunit